MGRAGRTGRTGPTCLTWQAAGALSPALVSRAGVSYNLRGPGSGAFPLLNTKGVRLMAVFHGDWETERLQVRARLEELQDIS